jgi:hypothetical protein
MALVNKIEEALRFLAEQSTLVVPYINTSAARLAWQCTQRASPPIETFMFFLAGNSQIRVHTMIISLVYLRRLRSRLPYTAQGQLNTSYSILLTSLVLSEKYFNDSTRFNNCWSEYSIVPGYPGFGFVPAEINRMERKMLRLLDWNLRIEAQELYAEIEPLLRKCATKLQPLKAPSLSSVGARQYLDYSKKPPWGMTRPSHSLKERETEFHSHQSKGNDWTKWWCFHDMPIQLATMIEPLSGVARLPTIQPIVG